MAGLKSMFDIPLLDKFTEMVTKRFSIMSEKANIELYEVDLRKLRNLSVIRGND